VSAPLAVFRGGNQIGKSYAQAVDVVDFARGVHPSQSHAVPVKIAVASKSWKQMVPLLSKIWDLLPSHEIDPAIRFTPGQGIKGYKEPVIPLVAGPGSGSVIYLYTYDAGTQRLAGSTFHRAYLDEPPPASFFGEMLPRLNAYGGHLRCSFTPTPDAPPQGYMRAMVERWEDAGRPDLGCAGGMYEHHVPLSVEATTPRGGLLDLPWMTEDDIEQFSAALLEHERGMRLRGDWEPVLSGRWLSAYDKAASVHGFRLGRLPGPPAGASLFVGIDHGAGIGKQAAALVAVHQVDTLAPRVWVLDCHVAQGYTTPEQDADAIADMLTRWDLKYEDVDQWVGDRSTNANHFEIRKGNAQLRTFLAARYRIPKNKTKWITTPKKWSGSVRHGFRLLNAIMARRDDKHAELSHFVVHPRAQVFGAAAQEWTGRSDDASKDILDAVRYAVERAVRLGDWSRTLATTAIYA
jgi:phage terminase large subunit-like protein